MNKDQRLTKLSNGQYRMWRDTHTQLVPKGQSITQPLMPEAVRCKIETYGKVVLGYMSPPVVDYLNTNVDTQRFDKYDINIFRRYATEDSLLPYDNPDIDYVTDMGITKILTKISVKIGPTNQYLGYYSGYCEFNHIENDIWVTGDFNFSKLSNQSESCTGVCRLVVNPSADMLTEGQIFSTQNFLQTIKLPVSVLVKVAVVNSGVSYMPVLTANTVEWPLSVVEIESFELVGGTNV